MKTGTGTVRRFVGDNSATFIGIERGIQGPLGAMDVQPSLRGNEHYWSRGSAFMPALPALVDDLLKRYGTREGDYTDMQAIIGQPCRFETTECGLLTSLTVLVN
jgi:hypothetical protein